ncbi:MAG: tetratricopeptide repeat protein [Ruminococcus sp.]|nr:tetratricopeptide repeat protein [Ruminococcus sp.]
MRCQNCGAHIPEGMMICPDCRVEVQMVPDYNPLEDVLAREVKGSVEGATRPIQSGDLRRYQSRGTGENARSTRVLRQGEYGSSTRVLSPEEMNQIRRERMQNMSGGRLGERYTEEGRGVRQHTGYPRSNGNPSYRDTGRVRPGSGEYRRDAGGGRLGDSSRYQTGNMRQNNGEIRRSTGAVRGGTGNVRQNTGEVRTGDRRSQAVRKKRAAKRRLKRFMIGFLFLLILCAGGGLFVYQNSYAGILAKGQSAFHAGEYSAAEKYFNRAIERDNKKADAYLALARLYTQQKNLEKAERVFLTVIDSQPENADLYRSAIQFYEDTDQLEKISSLLEGCDQSVLSKVKEYVSEPPVFSLDDGTYQEVQQISLTGEGKIFYTVDGTEPAASSTLYKEPILVEEGTTVIKAININEKGIPSLVSEKSYTVELPVEGAPAITPSTGRYNTPMQITILVPEGYTAYYTMDGTDPSAASTLYTGPIDMPEGTTIFAAVLVSNAGKMTQVTKRSYELAYE